MIAHNVIIDVCMSMCVQHGDFRLENLFFAEDGKSLFTQRHCSAPLHKNNAFAKTSSGDDWALGLRN